MKFISYAQNFEDVMLWRALKHIKNGFYIDVGAYDPTEYSVTKWFYDNGWSGINVEPVISCYRKFLLERSKDINLDILILDEEKESVFYESSVPSISSIKEDYANLGQKELNSVYIKLKKKARTLNTICVENAVDIVHFLKIDVEGFELNVLRGFSFNTVRPWIVVFEAVASDGKHEDISSDCVSYLKCKNYHQVYFDGLNKFFVSNEHSELDTAFLVPLNIFDHPNIQLNNTHWLINDKISSLEQIIQQKEKEIQQDIQEIQQKIQEIQWMQSSKFWKMRNKYLKLKSFLKNKL